MPTTTVRRKKSTGSKSDRPDARRQAPVAKELEDKATGRRLYERFAPEVAALELADQKLPPIDIPYTSSRLLWICSQLIDTVIVAAAAMLVPEWRERLMAAWKRLRPLNHALFFAYQQYLLHGVPPAQRDSIKERVERGYALARVGKHYLQALGHHNLVDAATVAQILSGTNVDDMVADLVNLGEVLSHHQPAIAAMQSFIQDPDLELTPAMIAEMSELGIELRDALSGAAEGAAEGDETVDWRRQVMGLWQLLERDYSLVRFFVRCYLHIEGREDDVTVLTTLRGMTQAGLRRPAEENEADSEEQEPVDAEEPATADDEAVDEDGETEDDEA